VGEHRGCWVLQVEVASASSEEIVTQGGTEMRIDRNDRIAGQPILRAREYLRHFSGDGTHMFRKDHVARYFKVSDRKAAQIVGEFKAHGWIEPVEGKFGRQGYFTCSMKGNAFVAARAIPPLSREKAERLLSEFLKRVEEVNKRDELSHYVREVHIFGSYLNKKAKDLGDLDLAVDVRERKVLGREDIMEYMEERAFELGVDQRPWMARLLYVELEIMRLIKARNPYISLHPMSDLEATNAKSNLLFRARRD